jgi:uncharacterized tellurite resistance protein B-like protein
LKNLAEKERIAFYGALIWMAHSDGHLSRPEIEALYALLDLEDLSTDARRRISDYLLERPSFVACIEDLADAQLPLRHAIMANLIDVAMVDGNVDAGESVALYDAARLLSITSDQVDVLRRLLADVAMIRRRGVDDEAAIVVMQEARKTLAAFEIPLEALALCGSVLSLKRHDYDRCLKALGLEAFPESGVSAIILLGSATSVRLNALFVDDTVEEALPGPTQESPAPDKISRREDALGCLFSSLENLPRNDTRWDGLHEASTQLGDHVKKLRARMKPGGA